MAGTSFFSYPEGRTYSPPRPRRLHIVRPAAHGRSRSFRCSSSPHKVSDFAGPRTAVVSLPAVGLVHSSRNVHWTFLQRGQALPQAEAPVQPALLTVGPTASTRHADGVPGRHGIMSRPAAAEDCPKTGILSGYGSPRIAGVHSSLFTPAFSFKKRNRNRR